MHFREVFRQSQCFYQDYEATPLLTQKRFENVLKTL